jgi:hypothetical protein
MSIRHRLMGGCSLRPLKQTAFTLIDALQHQEDKALALDAFFLTAVLLSDGVGIDPHELVSRSRRQINEAARLRNPHLQAIKEFAAGELK